MCRTKNILIEIIEGAENKRTYVVRELPQAPNQPAVTLGVCESADELASFLGSLEIK